MKTLTQFTAATGLLLTLIVTPMTTSAATSTFQPVASGNTQIQPASIQNRVQSQSTTRFGGILTLIGTGGLGFQCTGLHCSCNGDADCNDMFSTNVCGDIAQCYEGSGGAVFCECLR